MQAPGSLLHGVQKGFVAIKSFFVKPAHSPVVGEDLRGWLNARPEIAGEAKQGFEQIQAGQYREVSRRKHA